MNTIEIRRKAIAVTLLFTFLIDLVLPTGLWALTDGPSLPEVKSFEPVTTTQMVDPHTGSFTYNIPLLNLPGPDGGYPFNLAYHSGVTMDQEASWVGLGWNLFSGAINRQVRNLPDDFRNDKVKIKRDMHKNWTLGVGGGLGFELAGADFSKGLGLTVGGDVYMNYYKGVGIRASVGLDFTLHEGNNYTSGIGLGLSFDSQAGASGSINASLTSKTSEYGKVYANGSIGATIHSRGGADLGLNMGLAKKELGIEYHGMIPIQFYDKKKSSGGSSNLSFSGGGIGLSASSNMKGNGFTLVMKVGAVTPTTVYPNGHMKGFFNTQGIAKDQRNKYVNYDGVGYLYMDQLGQDGSKLTDISRENDGMLHKNTTHLASPSLSYDIYSVVGQGIGNMFRPHRNDLGYVTEKKTKSATNSYNAGVEGGFGVGYKIGFNLGFGRSVSKSGAWKDSYNGLKDIVKFKGGDESYYFQTYGEQTVSDLSQTKANDRFSPIVNSEEPVAFKIELEKEGKYKVTDAVLDRKGETVIGYATSSSFSETKRKPRGMVVQQFTNGQLLDSNDDEMLGEYKVDYYNSPGIKGVYHPTTKLDYGRGSKKTHHIGGFTTVNNSGLRYVYALPAYNHTQKDYLFSVSAKSLGADACTDIDLEVNGSEVDYKTSKFSGGDKVVSSDDYYEEKVIPAYAHSYLLTSVLGTDYVDVTGDGPTEDDLGYWVKFNYVKTKDKFKWRTPFKGSNLVKGLESSYRDDKGAFSYGEKEVWYMATAETKTHYVEFEISARKDGYGVSTAMQTFNSPLGSPLYKLDEIRLYSKKERLSADGSIDAAAVPEKTVEFTYTYDLCGNVPNNTGSSAGEEYYTGKDINENKGKLTLKKVVIKHKGSDRGSLSPYVFDYGERENGEISDSNNPDYERTDVDRWGFYRPNNGSCSNVSNPYVWQNGIYQNDTEHNKFAKVWNLEKIELPSGGTIAVEYEANRYAYVQDKVAMQMTKVKQLATSTGAYQTLETGTSDADRTVYFDLEDGHLVSQSLSNYQKNKEAEKYIKPGEEMYFKIRANLVRSGADKSRGLWSYVGGYAKVKSVGLSGNDGAGNYTEGYVVLEQPVIDVPKKDGSSNPEVKPYHPFLYATWEHIRGNQPSLIHDNGFGGNIGDPDDLSESSRIGQLESLLSIVPEIGKIFSGGIHKYLNNIGYGKVIDMSNSFIRLRTPDKEKFGGGVRVRSLTFDDEWAVQTNQEEESSVTGQVFLYETFDDAYQQMVSSGVATYEPMIGGDEIPLRVPLPYVVKSPFKTALSGYTELPHNESLFPGATVGYSKVEVMTLNTYNVMHNGGSGKSRTGKTIHEFYTARDFPVRYAATELGRTKKNKTFSKFNLFIPIPFIGALNYNRMTGSQGYSIVLNDMPGKPKKVTQIGHDRMGEFNMKVPVSSVSYDYFRTGRGTNFSTGDLKNEVEVIWADAKDLSTPAKVSVKEVGVTRDFTTDMRATYNHSFNSGLDVNLEGLPWPPIPFPFPWPGYSETATSAQTVVTNKIIHKSGILKRVVTFDGASRTEMVNKYFDPLTGEPLLTVVNNNFDDPVYNYQLPARWQYASMGEIYNSVNRSFGVNSQAHNSNVSWRVLTLDNSSDAEYLMEGDIYKIGDVKATLLAINGDELTVHVETPLSDGGHTCLLLKSGKKNNLSSKYSSMVTLDEDPTSLKCKKNYNYQDYFAHKYDHQNAPSGVTVHQLPQIGANQPPAPTPQGASNNMTSDWIYDENIDGACATDMVNKTPPIGNVPLPDLERIKDYINHALHLDRVNSENQCITKECLYKVENVASTLVPHAYNSASQKWCGQMIANQDYDLLYYNADHNKFPFFNEGKSWDFTDCNWFFPKPEAVDYGEILDDFYETTAGTQGTEFSGMFYGGVSRYCPHEAYPISLLAARNFSYKTSAFDISAEGMVHHGPYWDGAYIGKALTIHPVVPVSVFYKVPNDMDYVYTKEDLFNPNMVYWLDGGLDVANGPNGHSYGDLGTWNRDGKSNVLRVEKIYQNNPQPLLVEKYFDDINHVWVEHHMNILYKADIVVTNGEGVEQQKQVYIPILPDYNCTGGGTGGTGNTYTPSGNYPMTFEQHCRDEVLSIAGTEFSDFSGKSNNAENPFGGGERGVWNGVHSYAYINSRKKSDVVDPRKDGVMSNVLDFRPYRPTNEHTDQWENTASVTQYNDQNNATESKDALGIYSSAFFEFGGRVNTGVASNAHFGEILFEDFEEYEEDESVGFEESHTGSNFRFYNQASGQNAIRETTYDILSAGGNRVLLDLPYDPNRKIEEVLVHATYTDRNDWKGKDRPDAEVHGVYHVRSMLEYEIEAEGLEGNTVLVLNDAEELFNSGGRMWNGRVIQRENVIGSDNGVDNLTIVTDAHTGEKALKPVGGDGEMVHHQLKLIPGEKYIISSWIKSDRDASGFRMRFRNSNGVLISGTDLHFPIKNTDGQYEKLKGEFVAPEEVHSVELKFYQDMIYDDVRIYPADGMLKTYVYDPVDFKLKAVLDENNYARMFYYDGQGNLYLTKIETPEGIKTISENRNHINAQQ